MEVLVHHSRELVMTVRSQATILILPASKKLLTPVVSMAKQSNIVELSPLTSHRQLPMEALVLLRLDLVMMGIFMGLINIHHVLLSPPVPIQETLWQIV